MKHSAKLLAKSLVGTLAAAFVFMLLLQWVGYERAELVAFSVLIGISIAALK